MSQRKAFLFGNQGTDYFSRSAQTFDKPDLGFTRERSDQYRVNRFRVFGAFLPDQRHRSANARNPSGQRVLRIVESRR